MVVVGVIALVLWIAAVVRRPSRRLTSLAVPDPQRRRPPVFLAALPAGLRRRFDGSAPDARRLSREDVADLVGRLAALTRAGVAPGRAWHVLAAGGGSGARVARVTSDMVASGGSTADGLRLAVTTWRPAAQSPPGALDAVGWLALTTDVVDRSGAPSAVVYDGMAAGLLAELARIDEEQVALAGTRTTAAILTCLPLAGVGLGYTMGANVIGILLGTPSGLVCLFLGLAFWFAGRWWIRQLVRSAATVTG